MTGDSEISGSVDVASWPGSSKAEIVAIQLPLLQRQGLVDD